MRLAFSGEIYEWRGPAPFHFVRVPDDVAEELREWSFLSYGWGMLPVTLRIGRTRWATALWPKNGSYVVPLKNQVWKAERLELGQVVEIEITVEGEPT